MKCKRIRGYVSVPHLKAPDGFVKSLDNSGVKEYLDIVKKYAEK